MTRGRPANPKRNLRMLAALDLARSGEYPSLIEPFGLDPWPKWSTAPKLPVDRQAHVMAVVSRILPRFLTRVSTRQFVHEDHIDAFLNAVAEELPHEYFQNQDEQALRTLLLLSPLRVVKTGNWHDQKMHEYRQAAAIFNTNLANAKQHGFRLDEKPTSWAAIQKLTSRSTQK